METTKDGTISDLDGDVIQTLAPDLVHLQETKGKTIREIRQLKGCRTMGTYEENWHGRPPIVFVFTDGTMSEIAAPLVLQAFATCQVQPLLEAGVVTPTQIDKLEKEAREKKELEEKIRGLRAERSELLRELDHRHGIREYRGIVRQVRGIEDQLVALGAMK